MNESTPRLNIYKHYVRKSTTRRTRTRTKRNYIVTYKLFGEKRWTTYNIYFSKNSAKKSVYFLLNRAKNIGVNVEKVQIMTTRVTYKVGIIKNNCDFLNKNIA